MASRSLSMSIRWRGASLWASGSQQRLWGKRLRAPGDSWERSAPLELSFRHIYRALMMRHHHHDEILVGIAGHRLHHVLHHLVVRGLVASGRVVLCGNGKDRRAFIDPTEHHR